MNFKEAISYFRNQISLEELCSRLGIETVNQSSRTKALCPFHDDTNPSMELYDDNEQGKAQFHCFSCGAHGDIFDLVKEQNSLDFKESVYWLAKEYNVNITNKTIQQTELKSNLLDVVTFNVYQYSLDFFIKNQDKPLLLNYINQRGYEIDFINDMSLCIKGNLSLVNHLYSLNLSDVEKRIVFDHYESAGLIKRNIDDLKSNITKHLPLNLSYFDTFRNSRLLFPIKSSKGEIKGFTGRLTNVNKGPKYLFSKNLNKSNLLYLSEFAFKELRTSKAKTEKLYICEGLFDALRFKSLGFNSVSILGANLSDNQCKAICDIARELKVKNRLLEVVLFLDNDTSGIKATSLAIKKLYKNSSAEDLEIKVLHPLNNHKVDPDSFLKNFQNKEDAEKELQLLEYPVPAIFIANELNISTSLMLKSGYWNDIPYSLRIRASKQWNLIFDDSNRNAKDILNTYKTKHGNENWFQFLDSFSDRTLNLSNFTNVNFVNSDSERLNLAFALAKSSHARGGAFPDNTAEWRRIEMCTTVLDLIIKDRFGVLRDAFKPIEPLNTVYISRATGGIEPRVMSLHCPEDLISHQYVMSELISERHDISVNGQNFSSRIPVTRYYRKSGECRTTGEGGKSSYSLTLSFAYQIDMEILEGREKPHSSGMFRPYFDCWKAFTNSINNAASKMSKVHMVRLDLKRYYDELKRFVVQDKLRECLPVDLDNETDSECLRLFCTQGNHKRDDVINWLLEQSFGYQKFSPENGEVESSDISKGIPQGPDLSAFLANLVLFTVDSAAREFLEKNKNATSDYYPVWYSRYVDDMVLIAEDAVLLSQLRAVVEDAVQKLELELVAKEQPMPKSPESFKEYLTKGKALSASGPEGTEELIEPDEIEFVEKIERFQALGLLNNRQLYSDSTSVINLKIAMAAHGQKLRFSDLSKLTKWIWFSCVKSHLDVNQSLVADDLVSTFTNMWSKVTSNLKPGISPEQSPWEDPLLLAFDGLDLLLERNSWVDDDLTDEQISVKSRIRNKIANCINSGGLLESLSNYNTKDLSGWGVSLSKLPRTYWQKKVNLYWHSSSIKPSLSKTIPTPMFSKLSTSQLKNSLARTYITESIYSEVAIEPLEYKSIGKLRDICILLQVIYHKLGMPNQSFQADILNPIEGEIKNLLDNEHSEQLTPDSYAFFNLLLCGENNSLNNENLSSLKIKALNFICNVSSKGNILKVLSNRWDKLINSEWSESNYTLIPPLPTIDETTVYGFSSNDIDKDNHHTQIDGLIKLCLEKTPKSDDIFVSNSSDAIDTNWTETSEIKGGVVNAFNAPSTSLSDSNRIFLTSPNEPDKVNTQLLTWAANTFESILKCIKKDKDGISYYRVPNWSNVVMMHLPDNNKGIDTNEVCILGELKEGLSYSQAFIRDGSRGLRPLPIPTHNSHIWQAGVALTDILGFTRDLDEYASFEDSDCAKAETPQYRLLRNSLKKLNGSLHYSMPSPVGIEQDIPKTIERTLSLLRNFPSDEKNEVIYSRCLSN